MSTITYDDALKHEQAMKEEQIGNAVNHPAHYTSGGVDCIDAIEAALSVHEDPVQAWLTGQIIKYVWRWPMKGGVVDLLKARFYLEHLIEKVK